MNFDFTKKQYVDNRCMKEFGRDFNISESLPNLETAKA